jgi:sulfite reductase (NADPH) flavoprotein alpha-component
MSSFIPSSAPFNEEQRAWLNGFFSGLMGITPNQNLASTFGDLGIQASMPAPVAVIEEDDDHPWHNSSLPIVDRMTLADGKPIERRLMAAMAQLDCGSCGYVCKTYAEAIASGAESNLTLCSPGGKETKQMIKKLLQDQDAPKQDSNTTLVKRNGVAAHEEPAAYSRKNPFNAKLIESRPLNQEGSAKDTRHVVIDLKGSGLKYEVGDALGIYPRNCEDLVAKIITRIGADPSLPVTTAKGTKSLLDTLCDDYCLKDPSDELLETIAGHAGAQAKQRIATFLDEGVPTGFDVLDALELSDGKSLTATELLETLQPLNPRLYSIASSMKRVGNEVHLTVGKVTFEREGRARKGVASTLLAERLTLGSDVRVFVQPNHGGFTVPSDPTKPMIMVGPGTGIAPFMAFLQEREATKAKGKNWLFFGDQREAYDFLYEDDLHAYVQSGLLTRLDTAFSRDGQSKVYVQDRMRQNAAELWKWLQEGAGFYVCGDASRMAADVDRALTEIIETQGGLSATQAKALIKQMADEKRYVRDVY